MENVVYQLIFLPDPADKIHHKTIGADLLVIPRLDDCLARHIKNDIAFIRKRKTDRLYILDTIIRDKIKTLPQPPLLAISIGVKTVDKIEK